MMLLESAVNHCANIMLQKIKNWLDQGCDFHMYPRQSHGMICELQAFMAADEFVQEG